MKKILCFALIFCFCFLTFVGCSNISYYFITNSNGQINYGVQIELEEEKLNEKPKINQNQVLSNSQIVEASVLSQMQGEKIRIENLLKENLKAGSDFAISISTNKEKTTWVAKFDVAFSSEKTYLKAVEISNNNGETSQQTSNTYVEKKFFTIKKITTANCVFAKNLNANINLGSWYEQNFDIEKDVTFNQVYATPDRSLKSNANFIQKSGDLYLHVWQMKTSQAKQKQIKLYHTYPNVVGWYILTLCLGVVFIAGYFIYCIIKNPKMFKKKK